MALGRSTNRRLAGLATLSVRDQQLVMSAGSGDSRGAEQSHNVNKNHTEIVGVAHARTFLKRRQNDCRSPLSQQFEACIIIDTSHPACMCLILMKFNSSSLRILTLPVPLMASEIGTLLNRCPTSLKCHMY